MSSEFDLRKLLKVGIFFLVVSLFIALVQSSQSYTKIVICDVGQGDAIYIRTRNKIDILIDGGPNEKVLSCLGRHMAFYDRTIEIALLTHPHSDHYGGFLDLTKRYKIEYFLGTAVDNDNDSYNNLKSLLIQSGAQIKTVKRGDKINLGDDILLNVLWPTEEFLASNSTPSGNTTNVLGATETNGDLNDFSIVAMFSDRQFDLLLTGDTNTSLLESLNGSAFTDNLEILKVPHHGSANGLTKDFLYLADPELSVISVGAKNRYGHPSPETVNLLNQFSKPYFMTSKAGDIVIKVSDSGWYVED